MLTSHGPILWHLSDGNLSDDIHQFKVHCIKWSCSWHTCPPRKISNRFYPRLSSHISTTKQVDAPMSKSFQKNINRHIAHTIVSWPNPKLWQMGHTSDLMMIIRWSTRIRTIMIKQMGMLNTHSPIYCMKDNWDNWLNLRHTLENTPETHFII